MTEHPDKSDMEREERIRLLAYRLWEEEGCPDGKAEEHWQKATALLFAAENKLTVPDWLKRVEPAPSVAQKNSANGSQKQVREEERPDVLRRSRAL